MTARQTRTGPAPVKQATTRRRGRPAAKAVSGEQFRDVILEACAAVYAEFGYQGASVQRILQAAGVSRPTFYRYFHDRNEPLDILIGRVNDELHDLVAGAVGDASDFDQLLAGVVDAYFTWGERIGPLAGPIYREIHDDASPASGHRLRLLEELMAVFMAQPVDDRIVTEPLLYEAAMHVVEHLGHATFWPVKLPARERRRRREVILDALRGMLLRTGED